MHFLKEIDKFFGQQAAQYEGAALVQQEIGDALFERLNLLKINPRYILDLGCGTGLYTLRLKARYPEAVVVGLDIASGMLYEARCKERGGREVVWIRADMHKLPFQSGCFDLVFSNQVLHWSYDLPVLLNAVNLDSIE